MKGVNDKLNANYTGKPQHWHVIIDEMGASGHWNELVRIIRSQDNNMAGTKNNGR
jgi:hypothetical protein